MDAGFLSKGDTKVGRGCWWAEQKSNLNQHVSAVHKELKPYICSHVDCGRQFAYRAVRDKHEMSGLHFPSQVCRPLYDLSLHAACTGAN
jgi:general transcription factor IIIA